MMPSYFKIHYPNGRVKTFPYSSFDLYISTNELEHREDKLIITLDDLSRSFIYETDELSGEIVNKEMVIVELLPL